MEPRNPNPNRQLTIRVMIVTALVMLTLMVGALAILGGDETSQAIGKALISTPIFIALFALLFLLWRSPQVHSFLTNFNPLSRKKGQPALKAQAGDNLELLRRVKEISRERDEAVNFAEQLKNNWLTLFGTSDVETVTQGIQQMYGELELLRQSQDPKALEELQTNITAQAALIESLQQERSKLQKQVTDWQSKAKQLEEEIESQSIVWDKTWNALAHLIRQAATLNSISMNKLATLARTEGITIGKRPLTNGSFKLFTFTLRAALPSPDVKALIASQNEPQEPVNVNINVNEPVNESVNETGEPVNEVHKSVNEVHKSVNETGELVNEPNEPVNEPNEPVNEVNKPVVNSR